MQLDRQKTSRTMLHRILIGIGAIALFLPAITTNLFGSGLAGYAPESPAPRASWGDWLDGRFQAAADQWWKERFGMRFFFVKLDNEISWSVFGQRDLGKDQIVMGPNGWLFEQMYISAYCGDRVATPEAEMREALASLRRFQDAMDARGTPFVVLLSPSKAAAYPDEMPAGNCAPHDGAGVDYDLALPLLDEYGIRYVDGLAELTAAKPLWPDVTLFTKGGSHWNHLGAYYSAAALIEAARPLSTKPIAPLVLGEVVIDNSPVDTDVDLVAHQNRLFPDTDFPTAHPEVSLDSSASGQLRLVLVGTSFNEQLAALFAESDGFERVDHYWYYHHELHDWIGGGKTPLTRERMDWPHLLDTDILVLELTMLLLPGEHGKRFLEDGLAYLDDGPEPVVGARAPDPD